MENRYKQHKKLYENYQDKFKQIYQKIASGGTATQEAPKKDVSTAFFRSAQLLNMVIDQIKGFEKKFPPRRDGSPFLGSNELEIVIHHLENLAKHYHKKPSDDQVHRYVKTILNRLDTYQTFLNEYVEVSPQLDTIISDVMTHIQKVRKELRNV